jgi:hypothetical protein
LDPAAHNADFLEADQKYREVYPEAAAEFDARLAGRVPKLSDEERVEQEREGAKRMADYWKSSAEFFALPEHERGRFRHMRVNAFSRSLVRQSLMRWMAAVGGGSSCRPRGALRGSRRRSVRTGPRRARAPASHGDDPEPPLARISRRGARA